MSGRTILGSTSTKQGLLCPAQGHSIVLNTGDSRTRNSSISTQARGEGGGKGGIYCIYYGCLYKSVRTPK